MKGNAIIGQSGGPTSVINTSLAGVIKKASVSNKIEKIFGMKFGIEGLLNDEIIEFEQDKFKITEIIEGLKKTPSSILGSSRYNIKENDYPLILEKLKKNNIHYFFQIGGNGSMASLLKIEGYAKEHNYPLQTIGIPKTVDNDLFGTDHAPGFPSAARYVALSIQQVGRLFHDMQRVDQYFIYQSIGRHTGWLTAASVLAKKEDSDAPHLIYLPERRLNKEKFIMDVKNVLKKYGWAAIVVSEGLLWEDGTPVSATETVDTSGNVEFGAYAGGSVALELHKIIHKETGLRGEFQVTESLTMCSIDRASEIDKNEAYNCGVKAVELAEQEKSGVMVTIERISSNPYKATLGSTRISGIAGIGKPMDDKYINAEGNFVTKDYIDYIKPLVSELSSYSSLEMIKI